MAINATIQVRRGLLKDFDPTKMLPGEWAVSIDASTSNQIVWMCFAPGVCKRMGTYEDFQNMVYNATGEIIERYEDAFNSILEEVKSNAETTANNTDIVLVAKSDIINTYLPQIRSYVSSASASASNAKTYSESASASAIEASDSAEEAKKYSQNAFSTTPEGYEVLVGDVDLLKNSIIQTTDRTLYGSKEGGIKLIGIKGASEQGENPSPDNPQEIESVGDLKNLLEVTATSQEKNGLVFTVNEDKSITVNGTATADTYCRITDDIQLPTGKYVANGCPSGGSLSTYRIVYYYLPTSSHADIGSGYSFELNESASGACADIVIDQGYTANNLTFKPMIRKASVQNSEYKPYGYSLGIKAEGKNLLKTTATSHTVYGVRFTVNDDGSVVVNGSSTDANYSTLDIRGNVSGVFDADAEYILSGCPANGSNTTYRLVLLFYGIDGKSVKTIIDKGDGIQFKAPSDAVAYNCRFDIIAGYTANNLTFYPMIRKADIEDDTYEPYRSKSITIPLNEPLREGDEIAVVDGVWGKDKGRGKAVLDGSDDEVYTYNSSLGTFWISLPNAKAHSSNVLCTHYTDMGDALSSANDYGFHMFSALHFRNKDASTLEEWRAILAENPIIVEYELATPTFEPFTDQTPFYGLESFDTVTYISTDSEVEPNIELKFGKTEVGALTLLNYNQTNLNRIAIAELTSAVLALNQE